jgi:prepilin-type N-terminal cleavage/methylation domain-containing protein
MPMCTAADRGRERGFSLVEVLCALAIAASAIFVLTGGTTGSLTSARALDMHLGARAILKSILGDELSATDTRPDEREGESGPYRWRLAIVPEARGPVAGLPPEYRLYRLTATVDWGRGASVSASVLKLGR